MKMRMLSDRFASAEDQQVNPGDTALTGQNGAADTQTAGITCDFGNAGLISVSRAF